MSSQFQRSDDITFEMALQRLVDRLYDPSETHDSLVYACRAIGLIYGMDPSDVFALARADAAVAQFGILDDALRFYPEWCRQPGADYD